MAETFWQRSVINRTEWNSGFVKITEWGNVASLIRIHFSWGFNGVTPLTGAIWPVQQQIQVMGLCTTVGDGGGPPPNARTDAEDVDPPAQRWVYWEGRSPRITSCGGGNELVTWTDSGAQYDVGTKAMVSAAHISDEHVMSLWASWGAGADWPADGQVSLWFSASVLLQARI